MTTTSAAPSADSGASSASPTDPKDTGAPQAPASTQSRMMASIAAKRAAAAAAAPQAPSSPAGQPALSGDSPESSPGTDASDDAVDASDERKQAADVVPMAAFKARIGKLSDNVKSAREESARLAHENQRYSTAAQLLQEENERLRQQLREGVQYDARDEELADVRLSQRAKERADALAIEHEAKLREMQQNFVYEAEREQIKARLSTQSESALSTHRLANRAAVGAAMKCFEGSIGLNVPRSRFLPVKKTSDLLLVMSNLYNLKNGSLSMSALRGFPSTPLIKLGDNHFAKVH